jgi:hypothetical protein
MLVEWKDGRMDLRRGWEWIRFVRMHGGVLSRSGRRFLRVVEGSYRVLLMVVGGLVFLIFVRA